MRIGPMIALAFATTTSLVSPARADERLGLDFGYLHNRVALTDQTAIRGQVGRFAIRISLGRHFHFGGEVDEAWLAGNTNLPNGAIARTTTDTGSPLEGNMLAQKVLVGLHTRTGSFSVVADLAGGVRDTMVSGDAGFDIAGRKREDLLEARGRLDYWLSSTITVGAVASADLLVRENVALGMIVGMHFGTDR